MNKFRGHISAVESDGGLSLVSVIVPVDLEVRCIVIDTPDSAPYLVVGREMEVLFKETEVVIGLDETRGISLSNQIPCKVESLETGVLLSSLDLRCPSGRIRSIISTRSAGELGLKPGTAVRAMIKLNEIMLSPI